MESRMRREVQKRGGLFYKFVSPGNTGVPDRILITRQGRIVFVELKKKGGRLSAVQKRQAEKLRAHNVDARTVTGWEEAKDLIDEVFGR